MMGKLKNLMKNFAKREDFIFILIAVLVGAIFSAAKIAGDDKSVIDSMNGYSVSEAWSIEAGLWFTWSSRVFVNFIARSLMGLPRWGWCIYMCGSMYVLQKAISDLFITYNKKFWNLFIAFLICIMPWHQVTTAGWIATTATYFGPIAFGIFGLVPIAKVIRNEKMSMRKKIFCSIALFYGTNVEQMMVVALGCYLAMMLYMILKKRKSYYILVNLILVIIELINFIICPGNNNRGIAEIAKWFPNYGMMDFLDKTDIGIFSTLSYIFFDNSFSFIIVILLILSCLVFKTIKDMEYRVLGTYSLVILILVGPLKDITIKLLPNLQYLTTSVPTEGMINVNNVCDTLTFYRYCFCTMIVFGIVATIALVSRKIIDFIIPMCILAFGFASRVAIGFSPTVYASGSRTFEVFFICIIMAGVYTISNSIEIERIDKRIIEIARYAMITSLIVSLWEMAGLVGARYVIY